MRGRGDQKLPILALHNLWTVPEGSLWSWYILIAKASLKCMKDLRGVSCFMDVPSHEIDLLSNSSFPIWIICLYILFDIFPDKELICINLICIIHERWHVILTWFAYIVFQYPSLKAWRMRSHNLLSLLHSMQEDSDCRLTQIYSRKYLREN